jgi:hypothetical protein
MEHQGRLHQHQGPACRPTHQASWEDQVPGALLQDRDGSDFPQDDVQDLGENDRNKSLYLLDCLVISSVETLERWNLGWTASSL